MIKKLIGAEIEKYVGEVCIDDFRCEKRELECYHLIFGDASSLTLWETAGLCCSGWTTASFGHWKWFYGRRPFSHVVKSGPVDVKITEMKDYGIVISSVHDGSVIAEVDEDGGDPYYPEGFVFINKDFFTPTARAMSKRPVWIFEGSSGLGKSSLAALSGKMVFETDSVKELPAQIWADIIVIGNKREFSLESVKRCLPDGTKPIIVHFSE